MFTGSIIVAYGDSGLSTFVSSCFLTDLIGTGGASTLRFNKIETFLAACEIVSNIKYNGILPISSAILSLFF
jgi:hypothetical protein